MWQPIQRILYSKLRELAQWTHLTRIETVQACHNHQQVVNIFNRNKNENIFTSPGPALLSSYSTSTTCRKQNPSLFRLSKSSIGTRVRRFSPPQSPIFWAVIKSGSPPVGSRILVCLWAWCVCDSVGILCPESPSHTSEIRPIKTFHSHVNYVLAASC